MYIRVRCPACELGKRERYADISRTFNGQNELMAILADDSGALYAATYDGSSWTITNGGSALETSIATQTAVPFSFIVK